VVIHLTGTVSNRLAEIHRKKSDGDELRILTIDNREHWILFKTLRNYLLRVLTSKRVFWALSFLIPVLVSVIAAQEQNRASVDKEHAITGSWERRGLYYTFNADGTMRAVKIAGEPIGYKEYGFSTFKMGINEFIKFWGIGTDEKAAKILLLDAFTDTTAVIAFGTTFLRENSHVGLLGTWRRVENLKTMIFTILPDSVYYVETVYDTGTSTVKIIENRSGQYTREKLKINVYAGSESGGRFHVRFDNGIVETLLPVMYDDIMYVFDLTPGKADFVRVDPKIVPTYNDYKNELEKRNAVAKN